MVRPPKKLASRSLAAKPTAMPPTPPSASSPVTWKPRVCATVSTATTTVTRRASLPSASTVVRSNSSPRDCRAATTLRATWPMKRSRNQVTQATSATSRKASASSMKSTSSWCCSTRAMNPAPMTQSAASTGRLAVVTRALSQTVGVFRVALAAWRSSTWATWFTTTVTSAIATSEATHTSMPICRLSNSLNRSMPATLAVARGRCQRRPPPLR